MLERRGSGLRCWARLVVAALAVAHVQANLLAQLAGEDGGANDPYFSYDFAPQPPVAGQLHAALSPLNYTLSGCNYPSGSPGWCIPTEWSQISSFPSAGARFMHGSTLANCTPAGRYYAPASTFLTKGATAEYATVNISAAPPAILTGTTLDSVTFYVYADGVQVLRTEGPTAGVFSASSLLSDPGLSCFFRWPAHCGGVLRLACPIAEPVCQRCSNGNGVAEPLAHPQRIGFENRICITIAVQHSVSHGKKLLATRQLRQGRLLQLHQCRQELQHKSRLNAQPAVRPEAAAMPPSTLSAELAERAYEEEEDVLLGGCRTPFLPQILQRLQLEALAASVGDRSCGYARAAAARPA